MNINGPQPGDLIVVWFSCGAASAVAAKTTIEMHGDYCDIRVVNNPIKEEDEDNRRFLKDVEKWIGKNIEIAINPKYPDCSAETVWKDRRYMSGVAGAPCTVELKKEARRLWESNNNPDWHVLGFTKGEETRSRNFYLAERENFVPVLINEGITKDECYKIINEAGILLPKSYRQGYPNANCKGCVKATSPTYWNHVRKHDKEAFDSRAKFSREIGCRLVRVKGKRIFLDELDPKAKGNPMKSMDIECGIFCEEKLI